MRPPTPTVELRAYGELAELLTGGRPDRTAERPVEPHQTVKDVVEAAGIPHTEVDLVVIDGEPVSLSHRPSPGDRLAVYPTLHRLAPPGRLQPPPAGETRFVADVHLGGLARLLRLLGFDVRAPDDVDDEVIATLAAEEDRIVLTRDRGLLKRRQVVRGVFVRSGDPETQAIDVVRHLELADRVRPLTRCLRCGGRLGPAAKVDVLDQLEPLTRRHHHVFRRCARCGRAYWAGSHQPHLERRVTRLVEQLLPARLPADRPGAAATGSPP